MLNKKKYILIIIMMASILSVDAQILTPSVISTAGSVHNKSGKTISYTIGQLITPSFKNKKILTQGFQQANPIIVNIRKKENNNNNNNIKVSVFPNPTYNFINIRIKDAKDEKYIIQIYDIFGRLLIDKIIEYKTNNKFNIDIQNLNAGQYMIRIVSFKTKSYITDFKFIKLNK